MSNKPKLKGPVLISRGQYAIHESPHGDGVITYRPDGAEEDSHTVVPKMLWSTVMKSLRGEQADMNPMALMKMMMGK